MIVICVISVTRQCRSARSDANWRRSVLTGDDANLAINDANGRRMTQTSAVNPEE